MLRFSYKNNLLGFFILTAFSFVFALTSNAERYDKQTEKPSVSFLIHNIIIKNESDTLNSFYEEREDRPLWISNDGSSKKAKEILKILETSWVHGFNPETYHVMKIRELLESPNYTDKARLELLLSDAVMLYGRDLSGMRIDPKAIKQKAEFWRKPMSKRDVAERIAQASDPVRALKDMGPKTVLYKALQKELIRLSRKNRGDEDILPMRFSGDNNFIPGEKNKDVIALRARLGVQHKRSDGPADYYDDRTASAVMTFQKTHNLEPDGIIGPQTRAVLNRGKKDRMEQIVANLERLRWLEQDRPERYLLVNIPQQILWAVEKGKVVDEQKVVVGMVSRKTMAFKTEVTGVRFNPTWTVPLSLKMSSFLPKLKKNPAYLAEKKVEIIKGYGRHAVTLDPMSIDWENVGWKEMGTMRFVQTPGAHNALGRVRILMQNGYDIYMHDTNHPEFFKRGQRTYSSGCVRLEKPRAVASFVLSHNKDWSDSEMEALTTGHKTVDIKASKSFPVYIIYQSMWLNSKGELVFGSDVYKRDKKLINVLKKMGAYTLPTVKEARAVTVDKPRTTLAYNK